MNMSALSADGSADGLPHPTLVVLLRHGETEANSKGVLQGQSESPLTALGRSQAAALGSALGARVASSGFQQPLSHTVYSSDLSRASDTAQAVIDALSGEGASRSFELRRDARLRERRLGPFQGLSVGECHRRHALLWNTFNSGEDDQMVACVNQPGASENGGVELRQDMTERAVAVMRDIAAAHPGESVLVVSHGGFIHHAVCAMSDLPEDEVPHIGNCTVTTLVAPAAAGSAAPWRVQSVGEHAAHGTKNGTGSQSRTNVDLVGRGNIKAAR